MERNEVSKICELTDDELTAVNGGGLSLTFCLGSGHGKLGVALNAAGGGSTAEAAWWYLFH